jgi:hypothetical protein
LGSDTKMLFAGRRWLVVSRMDVLLLAALGGGE